VVLTPTFWRAAEAARLHHAGHWWTLPLGEALLRTASLRDGEVALVDGETRLTFSEWERESCDAANAFLALGARPGDVIAYQLPNWWEAAVVFLGAARIGAIVNPVLPIFRERELRFVLRQSRASVLVVPDRFRGCDYPELIGNLRGELPDLKHLLVARGGPRHGALSLGELLRGAARGAPPPLVRVDPDGLLMLMYTSGTTAEPKGVLHTHNTLMSEVRSLQRVHDLSACDTTLMPSPLTHISGVVHAILAPALLGTRAVLMERWDAGTALRLIAREGVTYMVGAPTFLADLIDDPERETLDLSRFRLFSCGGASVSADLIRRGRARLGCVAKRVYGSTEFPTITTTDAADADCMGIETEGRAIEPVELRVVDADGRPLPAGREGEVQARGPECFVGYVDATLNADAFTADGWFRTGDLGTLDANGYLRITGRLKDIVIRKGEKFSVQEVEGLIALHPAVAEVVVLALPDPRTGERACAAVELRPGHALELAELADFLSAHRLAPQKLPEQLAVLEHLPRTESGKLHRAAIKEALLEIGRGSKDSLRSSPPRKPRSTSRKRPGYPRSRE
jgi:cyclohexanecarboxylate-CoA ligase